METKKVQKSSLTSLLAQTPHHGFRLINASFVFLSQIFRERREQAIETKIEARMSGCSSIVLAKGSFFNKTSAFVGFGFLLLQSFLPREAMSDVHVNENVLTMRIHDEPETLDWNKARGPVESYILTNLMEGLVSINPSLGVEPALAASFTVSPDGKTYIFKIRPGVKWSDGVPLKAEDFVTSWKRLLSPVTAAAYAYFLFDIEGAEQFNQGKITDFNQVGVRALNQDTLVVQLRHAAPYWKYIPSFWVTFPLRKDIIEKYGNTWQTPGRMVTVGPFVLISHDLNSNIMMKSNVNYYGSRGNIDKVIALMIKSDDEALKAYDAGKLDVFTGLSALHSKKLQGRADLKNFAQLKTGYLGFVTEKFPMTDTRVRRAIAMAIDKKRLVQSLFGANIPAGSFIPSPLMGSSPSLGLPFDPVKAQAELKLSGVLPPGSSLKLEYIFPDWDKTKEMAQMIEKDLEKNLNLDLEIIPMENKIYRSRLDLHSYPLFFLTWTADFPDPDNFLSIFVSNSGNNLTGWKSEAFDQAVQSARIVQDKRLRQNAYIALQKTLIEDEAVIIPLYYEPNLALVRPRVRNLSANAMDYLYLRNVNVSP